MIKRHFTGAVLASLLVCCLAQQAQTASPPEPSVSPTPAINPGAGKFIFTDAKGDASKHIPIWTWAPENRTSTTPIVIVMHGTTRDAEGYFKVWSEQAKAKHFILIVPEFSKEQFPGTMYNDGNMIDQKGKPTDPRVWIFTTIEHLFDDVKAITGNQSAGYSLFGHSAGGQLVERFVMFMPDARYIRAVAANPGWYTLPDFEKAFPAGLKDTTATPKSLAKVCGRSVIVLLGEKDVDPNDPELPKYPDAMAEGPYRFARGQFFFQHLTAAAAQLKVPLAWQLKTVPNAGHSDRQMSAAAADVLFPAK